MSTQLIIDIVWIVVMLLGIGVGRYTGDITGGEFYLALMLAMFVGRWMTKEDMEKEKEK